MVFLGNPGKSYARTRHNVGWMTADHIESGIGPFPWREKFNALVAKSGTVQLLKPQIFMNRSGESVQRAASFFSIDPGETLVIHDDLELGFGTVRFERGGGLHGHNGLKSIRRHLGTADFFRLRIGIGRPLRGTPSDFVLSRFSADEEARLPHILNEAGDTITQYVELR